MKHLIPLAVLFFAVISCKTDKSAGKDGPVKDPYLNLYGNWVGEFVAQEYIDTAEYEAYERINIKIKKISDNGKVKAESIVAGNKRPLSGTMKEDLEAYHFMLREPGDKKSDGVFEFQISKNTSELEGRWISFNRKLKVTGRRYSLEKAKFAYNKKLMLPEYQYVDYRDMQKTNEVDSFSTAMMKEDLGADSVNAENILVTKYAASSEAIYILNASARILKADELKDLRKLDLEIIRSTIYARHGYTFKKSRIRRFFDEVEWYIPISTDVSAKLTKVEVENIALIKRFENYAENYYDEFGR